jgi:hypothetical protein
MPTHHTLSLSPQNVEFYSFSYLFSVLPVFKIKRKMSTPFKVKVTYCGG